MKPVNIHMWSELWKGQQAESKHRVLDWQMMGNLGGSQQDSSIFLHSQKMPLLCQGISALLSKIPCVCSFWNSPKESLYQRDIIFWWQVLLPFRWMSKIMRKGRYAHNLENEEYGLCNPYYQQYYHHASQLQQLTFIEFLLCILCQRGGEFFPSTLLKFLWLDLE